MRHAYTPSVALSLDPRANLSERWQDSEEGERPTIDEDLVVRTHLEGAVRSGFEGDIDTEIAPKHGRRPGSLDRRDSINATTDDDAHQ